MKEIKLFSMSFQTKDADGSFRRPEPIKTSDGRLYPIVYQEKESSLAVDGEFLDGQFEHDGKYILIVSSGFSESVSIYVLNHDLVALDQISISYSYSDIGISKTNIIEPDSLRIELTNSEIWKLKILLTPRFVFPKISLYSGVSRPLSLALKPTYLELTKI